MKKIKSETGLRAEFWRRHGFLERVPGHSQNEYPKETRVAWIAWIDEIHRKGQITSGLAGKATL